VPNHPYPLASEMEPPRKDWEETHLDQRPVGAPPWSGGRCSRCHGELRDGSFYIAEEQANGRHSVANPVDQPDTYYCSDKCIGHTVLEMASENELSCLRAEVRRAREAEKDAAEDAARAREELASHHDSAVAIRQRWEHLRRLFPAELVQGRVPGLFGGQVRQETDAFTNMLDGNVWETKPSRLAS